MSGASTADAVGGPESEPEPMFRVVRGVPTDVELAALSVVLAARMRPADEPAPPPPGPSAWAASGRLRRATGRPGPDAWRLSARH